jgi:hypothetical protein
MLENTLADVAGQEQIETEVAKTRGHQEALNHRQIAPSDASEHTLAKVYSAQELEP